IDARADVEQWPPLLARHPFLRKHDTYRLDRPAIVGLFPRDELAYRVDLRDDNMSRLVALVQAAFRDVAGELDRLRLGDVADERQRWEAGLLVLRIARLPPRCVPSVPVRVVRVPRELRSRVSRELHRVVD